MIRPEIESPSQTLPSFPLHDQHDRTRTLSADSATNTYTNGGFPLYLLYDTRYKLIFYRYRAPTRGKQQKSKLVLPVRNLAPALHPATVYDLGSTINVTSNIYTRLSTLNEVIRSIDTNATTSKSPVQGSTEPSPYLQIVHFSSHPPVLLS